MRASIVGPAGEGRDQLAEMIAAAGYSVCAEEGPGDGADPGIDLVVIDAAGESERALAACRSLGQVPAAERPYILVVNAPADAEVVPALLEAGADDLLTAPLDPARLALRVEIAIWRLERSRQAERELADAQQRYRALLEQKIDAVFVLDEAGRYLDVNEAACDLTGYGREELLSMTAYQVMDAAETAERPFHLKYLASGGSLAAVERTIRRKDGSAVECETSIGGMPDGRIMAVTRDISARKRAEAELRQSQERYRTLFEQSIDAVLVSDSQGVLVDANRRATELFRYRRDELVGMDVRQVIHPEDLGATPLQVGPALAGALVSIQRRFVRKDGTEFVGEAHAGRLEDGRILGIVRDITQRVRADEALRESEARFRELFERAPVMLHSLDREGRVVAASDLILEVLGYERDEAVGQHSSAFLTPESAERVRTKAIPELLRAGIYWNEPYQMVKRNGDVLDIVTSARAVNDAEGRFAYTLSVSIDVTAQRQAERALRESEERLRLILDVSPDLVGWIGLDGRLEYVNAAHTPALGYQPQELVGQSALDLVHPGDIAEVVAGMQTLGAGQRTERDGAVVRFRRADGSWAYLEMRARGLTDREGNATGIIVVSRDVSERLAQEEALREANAFRDLVMDSATNAIYAIDLEGRFTFLNRRTTEITGFPEDELVGSPFSVLFEPESLNPVQEQFARAAFGGERVSEFETDLLQKDGTHVVITFSLAPLVMDGTITGVVGTAEDITERKRATEALQERERTLSTLLANLPGASYRCRNDRDWTMEFISDGCFTLTGYPPSDFCPPASVTLGALIHPDDRDPVWEGVQGAVGRHEPFELNYRIATAWGEERRVWERGQGVFDERGELVALERFIMDVTDRERALALVHQSEERYRRLVEMSPNAIVVHQGGLVSYANGEALRLLGASSLGEVAGRNIGEFIDAGELARAREAAEVQSHAEAAVFVEVHVRRLDGTSLDVELSSGAATFDGRLATQTVVRDISERKCAEEALRQSEERYRQLVEASPVAMVVHEGGVIRFANRASLEVFRAGPGETIVGRAVVEFTSPEEQEVVAERLRLLADGATSLPPVERRLLRLDGSSFQAEVTLVSTVFEGRPAAQVVVRDLSEQRQAEEVMRQSSEQYRRLVQMSPVAMAVFQDVKVTYANEECLRVFRAPSLDAAIGRDLFDFVGAGGRDDVGRWVAEFLANGSGVAGVETEARRFDGEAFAAEISAAPISFDGIPAALVVIRDLSEQKQAEEERLTFERRLLESQKLESLGVLAGGVAHDFNNLLVAIMGNASLSLMEVGEASPVHPYLQEIETAAQRAADLARQMLAYSGKGRLVVSHVDVNDLVNEMAKLVSVSIPKKVMLEWQLADTTPAVEVDATQLRQVVMNLVINAAEAIGDHEGVIRVSTGVMEASPEYLASTFMPPDDLPPGKYVFFEVADTGAGMDEETLAKMFDPFFTTKFTGRGLGMAAVLGIVRGHRGAIRVESRRGEGTTIRVLLPPVLIAPAEVSPEPTAESPIARRGRVLVIDDETSIRAVTSRILERMGFEVVSAADGAAGLESFRQHYGELSAVLLDLTMPQLGGVETYEELQEVDPAVPIVIMSGYSQQEALGRFGGAGPRGFLQKPFSLRDVEAALREALGTDGG